MKPVSEVKKLRAQVGEAERVAEEHLTTIHDLSNQVDIERGRVAQAVSERDAVIRELRGVSKINDDLRSQIAEMKERLANTALETARLQGFIDRVHEADDMGQAPAVERIERPIVRAPVNIVSGHHHGHCDTAAHMWDQVRQGQAKSTHWTSFGK